MRKLWLKYKNWLKLGTEQQVYRYTPKVYRYTLAKNDQNQMCTGTSSRCTGTLHSKMPRMCVFHPFFHILIHNQLSLQTHIKNTSNSPCNLISIQFIFQLHIFLQNYFMDFFQNPSNMGYDPSSNQNMNIN